MKIFLTGRPGSGKSTLLTGLLSNIGHKHGLSSPEVRENGERMGFNLVDNTGRSAVLSRTNIPTQYLVGRNFVNLQSLDRFIDRLFTYDTSQLLYIDEIGQIQLHSTNFIKLVEYFMGAENDFVGTISQVYSHPLISKLIEREDVLVCTVTIENRDNLYSALSAALEHRKIFNQLSDHRQGEVIELAQEYISRNHFISLRKLYKNAIIYVAEGRVREHDGYFIVNGFTDTHTVKMDRDKLICDCDLSLGRGRFLGQAQQCSHVQSIVIYRSA